MAEEHILVVEDEPQYLRLIRFNLETEGYRVRGAATGEDALALLRERAPDLVILDIMLPGIDGFEVCQRIREVSAVPIIMLTAKGAEEDKVKGLQLGADDYVTKPFSAQELLARVQAVLRRTHLVDFPTRGTPLTLGKLEIDFSAQQVTLHSRPVSLSPTEYRLLACLAASPGTVLSHKQLLERVWGPGYQREEDMLRVTLWRLRRKLEEDPSNPRYILTRPGLGYMLAASP